MSTSNEKNFNCFFSIECLFQLTLEVEQKGLKIIFIPKLSYQLATRSTYFQTMYLQKRKHFFSYWCKSSNGNIYVIYQILTHLKHRKEQKVSKQSFFSVSVYLLGTQKQIRFRAILWQVNTINASTGESTSGRNLA